MGVHRRLIEKGTAMKGKYTRLMKVRRKML
jgi:hypothetical protein